MKVRFRLQIHANSSSLSSSEVILERVVEMPYVPVEGMWVNDGDWEVQVVDHALSYDARTEATTLWLRDKTIYNDALRADSTFDQNSERLAELKQNYIEAGWRERGEAA